MALSVTDYGLGLTTVSQTNLIMLGTQTNLIMLGRVHNDAMRVILGTTKDTHRDHAVHARPLTDAKQSENGTGQCVLQCCRTSPQPPPRSLERHKEMQTGVGKVFDGSLRGLSTASIPADRELKQTKEWERYSNGFRHLRDTPGKNNLGR